MEAISSMGCHTLPIITTQTVQDTSHVLQVESVDPLMLMTQMRTVLEDIKIHAVKIGLLADSAIIEVIHSVLKDFPDVPVILDPVLSSGAGDNVSSNDIRDALLSLLIPLTTIITPNSIEARKLAPHADNLQAAAHSLMSDGAEYVLITGTHEEDNEDVINTLYGHSRRLESLQWPRLNHSYHGSGCTLASAIAGLLAQGSDPLTASHKAQQYTWETLQHAYHIGKGQLIPNRLFWARNNS
jgi:hydroxymethylpyrimidine/phosphomethylpyrimidine kinase